MSRAHEYAQQHQDRFISELSDLLKIPSVSTDPVFIPEVRRAAEWLAANMRGIGLENVAIMETGGHPIVYGDWLHAGADKPTVLIYGHYDVQPAVMEDGWTHPPFEPIIRAGNIYARGAVDDKGQVMLQLKAAESLLATDKPPVNIKYIIEGEEESGGVNLENFIKAQQALLKADVVVISDTHIFSVTQPKLMYGLRGLIALEVIVSGPNRDLHSGMGGMIHNPIQALSEMLAALHNRDGSVAVPGFYDGVQALGAEERALLKAADVTEDEWRYIMGDLPAWGEPQYTRAERMTCRPTLEINGIAGGYAGDGFKTVLPAQARAKISCRLVPYQDPQHIFDVVTKQLHALAPSTVRVEVKHYDAGKPVLTPIDHPAVQAAERAYEQHWGVKPIYARGGGTIPVVALFQDIMDLPVVLLGFGLPDAGAHGPDEHFNLTMFRKGVDTVMTYLHEVQGIKA